MLDILTAETMLFQVGWINTLRTEIFQTKQSSNDIGNDKKVAYITETILKALQKVTFNKRKGGYG